ncbi:WYL domain-containing protein [Streptomyces massasporeus]|uniref:WYL domain-containing protein n=1 Tax=Streptomyces massasporeus TaxID=67324 RepID=UPI0034054DA0
MTPIPHRTRPWPRQRTNRAGTRIELRFRSPQAAETLLAFGPDAEVLSPEHLRRALARRAAATLTRH